MIARTAAALVLLASAACYTARIDPDGTTRVRGLGSVAVETHACGPEAPERICVGARGGSMSETAGGLLSGLFGFLLGR